MSDRRAQLMARIMAMVVIDEVTGCWIWQGTTSGSKGRGRGYPRMKIGGRTVAVHRVTATHQHGYIPADKHVDHTCRNRLCVNPDHLEVITHRENCKRRDAAKDEG